MQKCMKVQRAAEGIIQQLSSFSFWAHKRPFLVVCFSALLSGYNLTQIEWRGGGGGRVKAIKAAEGFTTMGVIDVSAMKIGVSVGTPHKFN